MGYFMPFGYLYFIRNSFRNKNRLIVWVSLQYSLYCIIQKFLRIEMHVKIIYYFFVSLNYFFFFFAENE